MCVCVRERERETISNQYRRCWVVDGVVISFPPQTPLARRRTLLHSQMIPSWTWKADFSAWRSTPLSLAAYFRTGHLCLELSIGLQGSSAPLVCSMSMCKESVVILFRWVGEDSLGARRWVCGCAVTRHAAQHQSSFPRADPWLWLLCVCFCISFPLCLPWPPLARTPCIRCTEDISCGRGPST